MRSPTHTGPERGRPIAAAVAASGSVTSKSSGEYAESAARPGTVKDCSTSEEEEGKVLLFDNRIWISKVPASAPPRLSTVKETGTVVPRRAAVAPTPKD